MKLKIPIVARAALLLGLWMAAAPRLELFSQQLIISEYLAVNGDGLEDEDGDRPDWIEIQNLGAAAVDLDGWSLTDDPLLLQKWQFPARLLGSGDVLVVFASGKNRAAPTGELHANFSLASGGEYLALVDPAGAVVDHYPPPFPLHYDDVSYGLAQTSTESVLVPEGAIASARVPLSGAAGFDWTQPAFDDASWTQVRAPIGFDRDGGEIILPGQERNLARTGVATQSSTGFGGVASRGIDGNTNPNYGGGSITHTNGEAGGWWEVDLGAAYVLSRIVLWNRSDCCAHRLTNFRVTVFDAARSPVAASDHFTDRTFPVSLSYAIELPEATRGRYVRISKLGPDQNGEYWLSLAEVEVFEGISGFRSFVQTDVEQAMFGVGSSIYLRARFDLAAADIDGIEFMSLRVKYDDGFVAYLNGSLIAARNAPDPPAWSSAATAERADADAIAFESINVSHTRPFLRAGANVLAVQALNLAAGDPDLFFAAELTARRVAGSRRLYFQTPTPGAVNSSAGVEGFVGDTTFSHDRGFYDAPFDVAIAATTPGAVIRYTLDGSAPTSTRGAIYAGPVRIDKTTTLRAAAFKTGLVPTNVDTVTYVFLNQVIASPVMNRAITTDPRYAPQMRGALTDLPAISFVTTGTINDGAEVPVSVELLEPDGSPGFQVDAGVRYYGGAFTDFAKKNFRLYFRGDYGATKLRHPLFRGHERDIPAVEVFDQLELRGGSHDMNQRGFYMSNRFTDDTMIDMGNLNPHGRFVHLYLNGVYWGQYHLRERWNASMLAEYLGGEKEDYEAINGNWNVGGWPDPGVPYDGDGSAWTRIKSLRSNYEAIKPYLDVQSYVDFMLMFMFGNSEDEYRCVGPTKAGSGFKFFLNDADGFTRDGGNRTAMAQPGRESGDGPGSIFSMLLAQGHPDYKTFLADRIHEHFFNDGAMTPAKNTARLLERCEQVERAFFAESARWGYRTPSDWESAKNSYVNGVLPSRTAAVVSQFRAAGFYPSVQAPAFNRHGGAVAAGFTVAMTAPSGTVLYTVDGSDPRLPGGAVAPAARVAGSVETTAFVDAGAGARYLVPQDGALGLSWTAADFNDAGWSSGATGIGYEQSTGYEGFIRTDVEGPMAGASASVYIRIAFNLDDPALSSLALEMQYDDGYVAYLNGTRVASKNAPASPAWDSVATASHADNAAVIFESVDLSASLPLLRPGRNVLAIHGLNADAASSDLLFVPRLVASEPGAAGDANVLQRSTRVKARARANGQWSALTDAVFIIGAGDLRVTELMYHPFRDALADSFDREDYEYIELQNVGERPISLLGIRFTEGIRFAFPEDHDPDADLAPGGVVVVVKNLAAFASRYDADLIDIAGEYTGNLDNAGERVVLSDAAGNVLLDFTYSDAWQPETDGEGPSLEIVDARWDPAVWNEAESWQSGADLGSPGFHALGDPADGGLQRPGDVNQDARLDISDATGLLVHLFVRPRALPCGETLSDEGNRAIADADGDGRVTITDAVFVLQYLFRGGPAHALGERCTRIPGCPERCGR
jgi:hypothetical protein